MAFDVGATISAVPWGGMLAKTMFWFGYVLFTLFVLGMIALIWFYLGFKYKAYIFPRRGSTDERMPHSVGRIKKDRLKLSTVKGVQKWKLFWARKTIDPKGFECIYPGNNIFLYESAPGTYHPIKLTLRHGDSEFNPVPSDVSFWQNLEMRQAAQDYNKPGFMDKYGNLMVMSGTVLFCLILVGVTVYYTYQHANGVTSALSGLTSAIKNVNVIGGAPF